MILEMNWKYLDNNGDFYKKYLIPQNDKDAKKAFWNGIPDAQDTQLEGALTSQFKLILNKCRLCFVVASIFSEYFPMKFDAMFNEKVEQLRRLIDEIIENTKNCVENNQLQQYFHNHVM